MPLTSEQRKAKVLAKRGLQARIADKLELSRTQVSRCVETGEGSRQLKVAIARAIGCAVAEAFPPLQKAS